MARFGHLHAATLLLEAGTDPLRTNVDGLTAAQVADQYEKPSLAQVCRAFERRGSKASGRPTSSDRSGRSSGSGGGGGCATFEDKWVAATVFVSSSAAERAAVLAKPACSA